MSDDTKSDSNVEAEKHVSEPDVIETAPAAVESGAALVTAPLVVDEPTVGTGSYIGVSCAIAMLILTVILIGVVFLLRWIG